MKILIVCGGNLNYDFALAFMQKNVFDHAVAVDRGLEFFYRAGRLPDLIVGDFDSCSRQALSYFRETNVPFCTYRPEKDATDTELAVKLALEHVRETKRLFPEEREDMLSILGATGGRLDHFLGCVKNLSLALKAGIPAEIVDERNRIRLFDRPFTLERDAQFGKYVSLLAFAEPVKNLTLTGFFYPLSGYTMTADDAIGVSNRIVEREAGVSFSAGRLLAIESLDGEKKSKAAD